MSDEKVQPAMTREEWRAQRAERGDVVLHFDMGHLSVGGSQQWEDVHHIFDEDRPALAALALYGQPFGFTREDVTELRRAADCLENDHGWDCAEQYSLADRIEALLPPE